MNLYNFRTLQEYNSDFAFFVCFSAPERYPAKPHPFPGQPRMNFQPLGRPIHAETRVLGAMLGLGRPSYPRR